MLALIDGDMLLYECCFGVQYKDEEGEVIIPSFDNVIDLLDHKLDIIIDGTWASECKLYLTGSNTIKKFMPEFKDEPLNHRIEAAKTKPYKGNREAAKPYHYDNLVLHLLYHYPVEIAWGMEADDLICIHHTSRPHDSVVCTRDKDLRMVPGLHYGWECYKQPAFGPKVIEDLGEIDLVFKGGKQDIVGGGLKFFYSQMITGDSVDNIPGLPRKAAVAAYKALSECDSESDCFNAVRDLYEDVMGAGWRGYFKEQAQLLWIAREADEEGRPITYKMMDERGECL